MADDKGSERVVTEQQLSVAMDECQRRYQQLVDSGCSEDVAADRTFDAWVSALMQEHHCFDPRDRLFENKLTTILRS